ASDPPVVGATVRDRTKQPQLPVVFLRGGGLEVHDLHHAACKVGALQLQLGLGAQVFGVDADRVGNGRAVRLEGLGADLLGHIRFVGGDRVQQVCGGEFEAEGEAVHSGDLSVREKVLGASAYIGRVDALHRVVDENTDLTHGGGVVGGHNV